MTTKSTPLTQPMLRLLDALRRGVLYDEELVPCRLFHVKDKGYSLVSKATNRALVDIGKGTVNALLKRGELKRGGKITEGRWVGATEFVLVEDVKHDN